MSTDGANSCQAKKQIDRKRMSGLPQDGQYQSRLSRDARILRASTASCALRFQALSNLKWGLNRRWKRGPHRVLDISRQRNLPFQPPPRIERHREIVNRDRRTKAETWVVFAVWPRPGPPPPTAGIGQCSSRG